MLLHRLDAFPAAEDEPERDHIHQLDLARGVCTETVFLDVALQHVDDPLVFMIVQGVPFSNQGSHALCLRKLEEGSLSLRP